MWLPGSANLARLPLSRSWPAGFASCPVVQRTKHLSQFTEFTDSSSPPPYLIDLGQCKSLWISAYGLWSSSSLEKSLYMGSVCWIIAMPMVHKYLLLLLPLSQVPSSPFAWLCWSSAYPSPSSSSNSSTWVMTAHGISPLLLTAAGTLLTLRVKTPRQLGAQEKKLALLQVQKAKK